LNARDYYLSLQNAIHAAPHVLRSDVRFEEIDVNECYVRGILTLTGGFEKNNFTVPPRHCRPWSGPMK
jgi:hypothetical protein